MTDDLILVLDAGSSAIRCQLVDSDLRIIRSASRPWTYLHEPDAPEIARAFDPNACLQSARDAIAECMAALPAPAHAVSAIALTSQRQSLAFLDESGDVIYAGPNTDLRAIFEGLALDDRHGELIYSTTGHRPAFMTAPGKLAWFKHNRPDAYHRIAHVLTLADWLAFELAANLASEPTLASESGLLDITRLSPASDMFSALDLRCPVPEMREPISVCGALSVPGLALPEGVPVVTAGADTQCGLVGMGIVSPGSAGIVAGWSATVQLLAPVPTLSPDMKTWAGLFQRPGLWTVESNAGDMGNALKWLADLLFRETTDPYRALDEAAGSAPLGSEGVSAHLGPRAMNVSALGMITGGFAFPVPMTLGGPTRGQLARAALESFAYAIRANLEQAEEVAGFAAHSVDLGGGMTRSPTFNRVLTDVLGREVSLSPHPDATAIGAALIARTAIGQFPSLPQATPPRPTDNPPLTPNPQNAAEYQDHYHAWLKTQLRQSPLP